MATPRNGNDNQPDCETGSIIECQNQVLGERLPITGTGLTLNYRSGRTPGYASGLRIMLSGDSIAASVGRIYLLVEIAGRRFTDSFPPLPDQTMDFVWDGKDAFGRPVQGSVPAHVRVGLAERYDFYMTTDAAAAFGIPCDLQAEAPGELRCVIGDSLQHALGETPRFGETFWTDFYVDASSSGSGGAAMGTWNALGQRLGGWTLSEHHAYDPVSRTLYLGTGQRSGATSLSSVVTTLAGDGNEGSGGDGGPAKAAQLSNPSGVVVAPDGGFYIADRDNNRIRRVRADGTIATIAGDLTYGYGGDGGPATAAQLAAPTAIVEADSLMSIGATYGYTSRGELNARRFGRDSTLLHAQAMLRDSVGRIVQLTDSTADTTGSIQVNVWRFVYDAAGQLVGDSLNGQWLYQFSYDSNGNRMLSAANGAGAIAYSYDPQDRLLSAGMTTFTYSSNGDLLTKVVPGVGVARYTYDVLGNLVRTVLPIGSDSTVIEYVIDGQNRRIARRVDGVIDRAWLYQDRSRPVAELDGAGNVVSRFIYEEKSNTPAYMIRGGATYRIISDHLGSVRLVVAAGSGQVVQRADYDEWGRPNGVGLSFQPFGFAGGLYDDLTGLIRFGSRDYDPDIGRWTTKDPSGPFSDLNLYRYAFNDPLNLVDPTGRVPLLAAAIVGGAVSGLVEGLREGFSNPCASFMDILTAEARGFAAGALGTGAYLVGGGELAALGPLGQFIAGGAGGVAQTVLLEQLQNDRSAAGLTSGDIEGAALIGGLLGLFPSLHAGDFFQYSSAAIRGIGLTSAPGAVFGGGTLFHGPSDQELLDGLARCRCMGRL